jgi:hypothetical protein
LAPPVLLATPDEWAAHCRRAWAALPAWGFDRGFVAELAADHLPRVLGQMGLGQFVGRISPHARAIVGRGAPPAALPLDPDGRWMLLRLEPDSADWLMLDSWSHRWRCPSFDQLGADLVDLGAWRWSVNPAKAAFRIARICGQERPRP